MATNTAPTSEASPSALWPAPVFVLGVAALVSVCLCRPFLPDQKGRIHRDLSAAREQLSRPDGDLQHALDLAKEALASGGGGEAAFLAGSAHVRLAEKEPTHATQHWGNARQYL